MYKLNSTMSYFDEIFLKWDQRKLLVFSTLCIRSTYFVSSKMPFRIPFELNEFPSSYAQNQILKWDKLSKNFITGLWKGSLDLGHCICIWWKCTISSVICILEVFVSNTYYILDTFMLTFAFCMQIQEFSTEGCMRFLTVLYF